MGQRVEAGPRNAPAGERGHELRIDDAFLGIQGGQGESLLHMVRVGEHGGPVALAACPRRGGDKQDGQGLPALFAPVDVFEDRRIVVIGEGDALACVHDAAAADPDDHVAPVVAGRLSALGRHRA